MDAYLKALFKIYEGLERQGPGSKENTVKALNYIRDSLPTNPNIMDIGCGCGAQTFVLANELAGTVTAVDVYQPYLDQISEKVKNKNLKSKVTCIKGDMTNLTLDYNSFDLIWSEGAIYIMGFQNGLETWQSYLKPGGYLVVSELSWLQDNPPQEAISYWQGGYPGMKTVVANLALAEKVGLEIVANFTLPQKDWWDTYYIPLKKKIDSMDGQEKSSPGVKTVIDETREEMAIMEKYSYFYGYEFYILKKPRD